MNMRDEIDLDVFEKLSAEPASKGQITGAWFDEARDIDHAAWGRLSRLEIGQIDRFTFYVSPLTSVLGEQQIGPETAAEPIVKQAAFRKGPKVEAQWKNERHHQRKGRK